MSSKTVEKLVVKALSRYGFQVESGEYVNWSKNFKEADKSLVSPGGMYEVDLFIADSGKKYANSVKRLDEVKQPAPVVPVVDKPVDKEQAQHFTPKKVNPEMTKAEWADKDRRISRQGCIQAAIQAAGGDFNLAVELADKMLEFVNRA